MITWDEFKKYVDAKIAESKISEKEPEIEYIDFSYVDNVNDLSVHIRENNQLTVM